MGGAGTDGLLFTDRSAKKPASAANPKTTAGCRRVKFFGGLPNLLDRLIS